MSKHKLGFNSTDADTLAASDFVGSHLYAGGVLLSATSNALHVNVQNASLVVSATDLDIRDLVFATDKVDVTGSEVSLDSATLAALENITVSATDLDIRDLAFATDSVDVSGSEVSLDSATLAALENITVSATDLDIRDLAAATDSISAWTKDGSGNSVTSTGGALDVNIASADISFSDIANTAIENTASTVGTSSAAILASQLADRKFWYGYNNSNKLIYIGKSGVTATNGMPQHPGVYLEYRLGPSVSMHAIGAAASLNYRTMELS